MFVFISSHLPKHETNFQFAINLWKKLIIIDRYFRPPGTPEVKPEPKKKEENEEILEERVEERTSEQRTELKDEDDVIEQKEDSENTTADV